MIKANIKLRAKEAQIRSKRYCDEMIAKLSSRAYPTPRSLIHAVIPNGLNRLKIGRLCWPIIYIMVTRKYMASRLCDSQPLPSPTGILRSHEKRADLCSMRILFQGIGSELHNSFVLVVRDRDSIAQNQAFAKSPIYYRSAL